jgi:hypothetical protein
MRVGWIAALLMGCGSAWGIENAPPRFVPATEPDQPASTRALNFGIVYGAQWTYYLISQHETIEHYGSFKNWTENPLKPHFDKDDIDYNVIKHTWTGSTYYLFYRSRGYTQLQSFLWSVASSFAFEFTVETVTEAPSFQDLYQTPVYGTIVGIGADHLSCYFHSLGTWPGRALGYLFNPFTLLPFSKYGFEAVPVAGREGVGATLAVRF